MLAPDYERQYAHEERAATEYETNKLPEKSIKVVIIGECGEGKTCLVQQMVHMGTSIGGRPPVTVDYSICTNRKPQSTIGVDYKSYKYQYYGQNFCMIMWDTAGQEKFASLAVSYLRNAEWIIAALSLHRIASDLLDIYSRSVIAAKHKVEVDKIGLQEVWDDCVSARVRKFISIAKEHMSTTANNCCLGLSICLTKIDKLLDADLLGETGAMIEAMNFARTKIASACTEEDCEIYETSAFSGKGVTEFMTHLTLTAASRKLARDVNLARAERDSRRIVTLAMQSPQPSSAAATGVSGAPQTQCYC